MFAGLSCHSCNSIYDRRCGDPYDAYTTEIVDCEQVNTIKFGVGIFLIFYFYKRYWWISQNLTSSLNILLQVLIALQLMILLPQERRKLTHVEGIESFAAFCRKTVQTGSMSRFLILPQLLGMISRRQLGPFEQLKNGLLLVDGEVRVHRSCGFVPNVGSTADRDCFTRTGTHQVAFCKSSIISEPGKAYMLSLYWQPFPSDQRLPLRVQRGLLQQVLTSRLPLSSPPSISSSSPSFHLFPVQPNLFHKYSKPSLTQYGEEFSLSACIGQETKTAKL